MKTMPKMSIFYICLIGLLVIGCMCIPPGFLKSSRPPTDTPQNEQPVPENTPARVEKATPTPIEPAAPTQTPVANGLNPQGPWLLIQSDNDLWAINPDGSGLTHLVSNLVGGTSLEDAIQPGGQMLAVLTSSGDQIHELALNLLSMPDGTMTKITNLVSAQHEPVSENAPGDPGFEAVRAITERNAVAWSPDGSELAFIGFLEGETAEVYLYQTESQTVQRVSTDEAHNYSPSWSPDGEYMLYFGVDSFGTGAGMAMRGVWSAYADGSNPTWLYEPTDSSGEELLGWLPHSHTALLSTWNMICGSSNLRLYDIENMKKTVLSKDCFSQAAVDKNGTILYGDSSQVYMVKKGEKKGKPILKGEATQIYWSPDDTAFILRFSDASLMTYFDNDGEVYQQKAPLPGLSMVATYGAFWAWTRYEGEAPGVWISAPEIEPYRIFDQNASSPAWAPDNTLLFFGSGQIYRASYPMYQDATPVDNFDQTIRAVKWMAWPE